MNVEKSNTDEARKVRARLIATGGRMAQDFGFNRVAGQVMACLYLTDGAACLDAMESDLHLSKAAVSLACTQLERLGLIHRVRYAGDRKRYYRSADDIGSALRNGILTFARTQMAVLETQLQQADVALDGLGKDSSALFLASRVARMHDLNRRTYRLLESPLLRLFSKLG